MMPKLETSADEKARFAREMAESIEDLRSLGAMDDIAYKRTMRDLNRDGTENVIAPLSDPDIRAMRENARISQAVLAKYLNLTVDHVPGSPHKPKILG
jgi:putative transcriptional regulator